MSSGDLIMPTPWDMAVFKMPTWEIKEYSEEALLHATQTVGHHTVKVDSLADKRILHDHGFYYCDTLIEPYCNVGRLRPVQHVDATICKIISVEHALEICHGAFVYGRFHRDFNLPKTAADLRYDNWLKKLIDMKQVWGVCWQDELAGFIAHSENNLVLHAVSEKYRGKGLAKYWWSAMCEEIFAAGYCEVTSSISAANLAILNLYSSLGFSFRNSLDVYHRTTT